MQLCFLSSVITEWKYFLLVWKMSILNFYWSYYCWLLRVAKYNCWNNCLSNYNRVQLIIYIVSNSHGWIIHIKNVKNSQFQSQSMLLKLCCELIDIAKPFLLSFHWISHITIRHVNTLHLLHCPRMHSLIDNPPQSIFKSRLLDILVHHNENSHFWNRKPHEFPFCSAVS